MPVMGFVRLYTSDNNIMTEARTGVSPASGKVLIIDDEQANIRLLEAILKPAAYNTISVDNGMEGIELAQTETPDIILLDIMMPDLDGYQVTTKLKADPLTRNIPIVLITALESVDDKIRGIESGADDFLSKPVNSCELLARMRAVRQRMEIQLQMENRVREATLQAITDPLTGLYNRQYMKHDMERHMLRARRYEQPMSLFFIDVDNFKHINDTHGHASGDNVLKQLSRCFKGSLRGSDMIARYGGDEFIAILPGTNHEAAMCVAEKLRLEVTKLNFDMSGGCKVTISIGLTEMGQDEDFKKMIERADMALYQAKSAGRNRVASIYPGNISLKEAI